MTRSRTGRVHGARCALAAVVSVCVLASSSATAQAVSKGSVTLTFLTYVSYQSTYAVIIPSFERAHPDITVDVTYTPTIQSLYQLETTQLAAGNATDLLATYPGCGTPISICRLAKAGDLAPMLRKAWAKRLDPRVLAYSKVGPSLFAFEPAVIFDGLLTNDTMFKKLGLRYPQTFAQLLAFCGAARKKGTIPVLMPAQGSNTLQQLVADIALTTVYAKDKTWGRKLREGKATFEGTPGWHQALQEIVRMNQAECFQPGPAATTGPAGDSMFAQGQTLAYSMTTGHKGAIDAAKPAFTYTQRPFPAAERSAQNVVLLQLAPALSVNAHASKQNQAAAQQFVDFLARPDEGAVFARINGGLSEAQLRAARFPGYLSSFLPLYTQGRYGINPIETWWNASVGNALTTYGTGLLTGQESIDDVLEAMDAAWKLGPD